MVISLVTENQTLPVGMTALTRNREELPARTTLHEAP